MGCRYGIFLLVFNLIAHSFRAEFILETVEHLVSTRAHVCITLYDGFISLLANFKFCRFLIFTMMNGPNIRNCALATAQDSFNEFRGCCVLKALSYQVVNQCGKDALL